jgi:hypothetical protein
MHHPFCLVLAPNVAEGLPYFMSRHACLKNTASGGWTIYGAMAPSAAEAPPWVAAARCGRLDADRRRVAAAALLILGHRVRMDRRRSGAA